MHTKRCPPLLRRVANVSFPLQSYNVPSPNEMEVDTTEYVGDPNIMEKEPVAIINPDNLDQETDQLQDLPLANDCTFSVASRPLLTPLNPLACADNILCVWQSRP